MDNFKTSIFTSTEQLIYSLSFFTVNKKSTIEKITQTNLLILSKRKKEEREKNCVNAIFSFSNLLKIKLSRNKFKLCYPPLPLTSLFEPITNTRWPTSQTFTIVPRILSGKHSRLALKNLLLEVRTFNLQLGHSSTSPRAFPSSFIFLDKSSRENSPDRPPRSGLITRIIPVKGKSRAACQRF